MRHFPLSVRGSLTTAHPSDVYLLASKAKIPNFSFLIIMYDLIVIGGGPAGYVGAIRGAQLGKKVAVVEADRAGGTCLNWGCIPTKALLKNAELFQTLTKKADTFGLSFDNLNYDWSKVIGRSRQVSDRLSGGIEFLFKKNKVDYIRGFGSIVDGNHVEVTAADGSKQVIEGANILVSTGCKLSLIHI